MEEAAQPEPFWNWTDLFMFAGMGLPVFLVAFWITHASLETFTSNEPLGLIVSQMVGEAAMLGPLALLFRYKYDRTLSDALRLHTPLRGAAPSYIAGVGLAFAVLLVAAALRVPDMKNPMRDLMNDPSVVVWLSLIAVSIGPLLEEIIFRGLLQPVAIRSLGVVGGVLLSAVPFALLHGTQYAWSWQHVLLILMAGSGFGWWRVRTRSTGAATLMHAGYNSVMVVGFLIGRSAL